MYLSAVLSPLPFPMFSLHTHMYVDIGFCSASSSVVIRNTKQRQHREISDIKWKWITVKVNEWWKIVVRCMAFWGLYCYGVLFRFDIYKCAFSSLGCCFGSCDEYQMKWMKWWWLDVVMHASANRYKIMIILKMCVCFIHRLSTIMHRESDKDKSK